MHSNSSDSEDPPLLSYLVGRLDRAIQLRLRQILAPFELTIAQFTTLSVLRRRPGLSNAQLARRSLIAAQSMLEVLATLERRQLVTRSPDPTHRRVLAAQLTAAGQELVERAERATREFEAELVEVVGGERAFGLAAAAVQRWAEHLHDGGAKSLATATGEAATSATHEAATSATGEAAASATHDAAASATHDAAASASETGIGHPV